MSRISAYELVRRNGPLIISIPHLGRDIPEELRDRYSPQALLVEDTDWHLDRLYSFAEQLDATIIAATISRYVVDLNRPVTGESLYPLMITTSLCPTETFRGAPIYESAQEPDAEEIARRVECYWRPYHDALRGELARLRSGHRNILLWEAHSIASILPRLFSGKLPDFNFGTSDGQSCDESVVAGAVDAIRGSHWSWVVNGRFKGGFITRRYGDPTAGIHAIQLEKCQSLYMDETAPFAFRSEKARHVAVAVRASMEGALRNMDKLARAVERNRADILSG